MRRVGALRIPHLFVANLPDPTATAFLIPVPMLAAMNIPLPVGYPTADGPLTAADFLTLQALGRLQLIPLGAPLPGEFVITAAEHRQISDRVADYNAAIRESVDLYNQNHRNAPATLIDAWAQMKAVQESGVRVSRTAPVPMQLDLTTGLLGGLFSIDGMHPSNTGYAVVANWFIDAINGSVPPGRRIARVNVSQVAEADPLVPWNFHQLPACAAAPAQ
jgi:hypothetical protein